MAGIVLSYHALYSMVGGYKVMGWAYEGSQGAGNLAATQRLWQLAAHITHAACGFHVTMMIRAAGRLQVVQAPCKYILHNVA